MFRSPQRCSRNARVLRLISLAPLLVLFLLSCTSAETPTGGTSDSGTPGPAAQTETNAEPIAIRLGVAAGRRQGQTPIDALIGLEQVAARRFDILRVYPFWDSEFPDLRHQWASDGGRMLHVSINARRTDGTIVPWQTIATAPEGDPVHDELIAWIERLASYDAPIRITFHHEADIEPEFGSPQDFVAAWRRFVTLLDDAAPDIETVWVLTSFSLDKPVAEQFWPGDEFVDFIGADAFNWFGCRGNPEAWRSPQEVLAPLMAFGGNHPDKPLVLAELGSDEDPDDPGRKAVWFNELALLISQDDYARLDTVVFFHNNHDAESSCDWWLDSSETSAVSFESLATLPLFGGDIAPSTPDQCPVIAMVASSVDDVALVDGNGDGRFDFQFGEENRFVGIGDQSDDGADHRVLLRFAPLDPLPPGATLELRLRIGERQPSLTAPIELRLLEDVGTTADAFGQAGQLLEPALLDAASLGGHHVIDVTGRLDPTQSSTLRLQLATPPPSGDGQFVLYLGTGNAARSTGPR